MAETRTTFREAGLGLPSDCIAHRYGFDGHELAEYASDRRRHRHLGIRSTFAINTFYPEVVGGHYENRALVHLVGSALHESGLRYAVLDILGGHPGIVPLEGASDIIWPEEYGLLDSAFAIVGVLATWQFHAGGGGPHYEDSMILDFILPEERTRDLVERVSARCRGASVLFRRD